MRIDEYAFEQAAQAVFIMNDSAREQYATWEDLRSFMIGMAYSYGHNCTSFSTGGFQLSFSKSSVDKNDMFVTASVSSYVALQYAKKMASKLESIRILAE